ncbi:hypothetical protein [Streptomyces sp. HNM0574]|uniref:hypothetical protein n=1 Tax=Streptomyces sp. HNM0574 TaxID=2714954 RepID=UPI001469A4A7|nr:hypothetical protein [Streptomyces sp. HNM0574]NLU70379.1 hypothetical protein [Streptomyces sp. HNM0574]
MDRKGGPGHTVLLALVLAVPVVKVAYTAGEGGAVREVFSGMELSNWPDVLVGMVLTNALFGAVLGVVLSRVLFAACAARGAVPGGTGPAASARRLALSLVNPLAVGAIIACLFGPWWGLGTFLVAVALRQGIVVEYRTGRRGHHHRHAEAARPGPWVRRWVAAEQWAALALTVVVLPVLAFAAAVDGRAWTTVVRCEVTDVAGTRTDRLIELGRKGNGVVGWNLASHQVSNGTGCEKTEELVVRDPLWRS